MYGKAVGEYHRKMTQTRAVALCFPPHWYYAALPADLVYTGAFLRARGVEVMALDLSAGALHGKLKLVLGFHALRQRETYSSKTALTDATEQVERALSMVSQRYGCEYSFSSLSFPGKAVERVPIARQVGLSLSKNPTLPVLQQAVSALLRSDPVVVAVALVHPDQMVPTLALGRLLRSAGYRGFLCVYGAHEDVLSPEDLLDDVLPVSGEPLHLFFEDFDGVIVGEAETALFSLWTALSENRPLAGVPSLLAPKHGLVSVEKRGRENLRALARPDFSFADPALYPYPEPIVDVRMSRGCPWNRCAFCAITLHQEGYRALPVAEVAQDLVTAHAQLGTSFFRFRDDLLTPKQLLALARTATELPFPIRFSVRSRFEPELTLDVLLRAAQAGLSELWLGLESAVPRVRNLMQKGVEQDVVLRILSDAHTAGIRVRALCLLGFPGETPAERQATIDFLDEHQGLLSSCALTPFLPMKRSPIGKHPSAFSVTPLPDAVPRHERLRQTFPATWPLAPTQAELEETLHHATERLGRRFLQECVGPTLLHAMIHHSVTQNGWPQAPEKG